MKKSLLGLLLMLFIAASPSVGACESTQENNERIMIDVEFIKLDKLKNATTFARPSFVVLSDSEATIKIIDKLPREIQLSDGSTLEEVGIIFSIAPKLLANDELSLQVRSSYSSIESYSKDGVPSFKVNKSKAELFCKKNESVFLGSPLNEEIILIKITPSVVI